MTVLPEVNLQVQRTLDAGDKLLKDPLLSDDRKTEVTKDKNKLKEDLDRLTTAAHNKKKR